MSTPAFVSSGKLFWSLAKDHLFAPLGKWMDEHRKSVLFIVSFVTLFFLYSVKDSFACSGVSGTIACGVLNLLNTILAWIVQMLGNLFVLVIDVFMHFAAYNSFGSARPVQIGWPIVRDVCNMFFILILLVSAFATIIGYDSSLHYRNVLPKLLLQAILINFSKTLIQVLIDFSQVVMLSFVNAFQQAGAGNFSQLFHIQEMMNFSNQNRDGREGAALADYANVFISIVLAMILMIVANGVMVIMIMYVIARIIGLWMILIFSPIAFFATAVPGKLAKGLDQFTGKYWSRLSALLTGGPVVCFFIWLTFAIVQQATACNVDGQQVQSAGCGFDLVISQPQGADLGFLNAIGNSQNIATFIVGVAMMLMALEQAVATAGAVSDTVGKLAGTVKGKTLGLAKFAALAPIYAGRAGYNAADKRLDITGKASMAGLALTSKIPVVRSLTRGALVSGMTRSQRLNEEEAKNAIPPGFEKLSAKQKALVAASIPSMRGFATPGERAAYAKTMEDRAGEANMSNIRADLKDAHEKRLMDERAKQVGGARFLTDDDKAEIKNRAEVMANTEAEARKAGFLKEAQQTYTKLGDRQKMEELKNKFNQDAHLTKGDDREKMANAVANDKTLLNKLSSNAKNDFGLLVDLMVAKGVLDKNSAGQISIKDKAKYEKWMQEDVSDKDLRKNFGETLDYIEGNQKNGVSQVFRGDAENLKFGKDENGKSALFSVPVESSVWKAAPQPVVGLDGRPTTYTVDNLYAKSSSTESGSGIDRNVFKKVRSIRQEEAIGDLKSNVIDKMGTAAQPTYAVAKQYIDKAMSSKGGKMSMKDVLKEDKTGQLARMVMAEAEHEVANMNTANVDTKDKFDASVDVVKKVIDVLPDMKLNDQEALISNLASKGLDTAIDKAMQESWSDPEVHASIQKLIERASDFEFEAKQSGQALNPQIQKFLVDVRSKVNQKETATVSKTEAAETRQRWSKFKQAAEARREPPKTS